MLAMKVDEGRMICRTDSAFHLLRTPRVVGRAGERSRAERNEVGQRYHDQRQYITFLLNVNRGL